MKILDYNHCNLKNCKCGWNLHIGGKSEKELQELKDFLKDKIEKDNTNYKEKINQETFI